MGIRNWYDEKILPRVITSACGQEEVSELRAKVVPLAEGRVFELGCGGGLNQIHYDRERVTGFSGIDPNASLLEGARARAREQGWEADIRHGFGENIPFEDGAFDTVVCTYTLCSVEDPGQVMAEMRRILKPGGRLLFLEHGKAPDPGPARWQKRIEPVWKRVMGNCHLTREIGSAFRGAGFDVEPIGQEYFPKMPRWAGWMEWGSARRSGV
ncbi:ubiquinone/menaquinone biosynthesis C-methylase UbiE [Altererythrobacter atlanticus]|uniref:Methyltransferase YcgJ n=1 Tax=Croceibacterium atlanticum TaxID=1267766 RepID=A0A0F7KMA9_9SPHN|nr:class I SAM-dependent methyltransferase [Croceibacterium atlanticum]AKH41703.1 putative methyltransferase YcgJ [Croceibacterium atlanticum]MBB5733167.1 ubiquinone/menaquinone biosynthesis C-methylase UbiE [Croceibacterium atlanticum]